MKKFLRIVPFSVFLLGCASLTEPDLEVVISDYGTFEAIGVEGAVEHAYNYSGYMRIDSEWRWIEPTYRVPAELGASFGFCFDVHGLAAGEHLIDVTFSYPEMIRPDGKRMRGYTRSQALVVVDGVPGYCAAYSLEHDFEVVEGEWVFTIRYRNKVILERRFTLYAPNERSRLHADQVGA